MKKFISIFIFALFALFACDTNTSSNDPEDEDPEEQYDIVLNSSEVYEIYTDKGLSAFVALVNGTTYSQQLESEGDITFTGLAQPDLSAKLMDDIELNGDADNQWSMIEIYAGFFDGNDFTISGVYFSDSDAADFGFFGELQQDGQISNLNIQGEISAKEYVGALVSKNYGTIKNCSADVKITLSDNYAAGITSKNYGYINNCGSRGEISAAMYVGGIAAQNDSEIYGCYNSGAITSGGYMGGIVGVNYKSVESSENYAEVLGEGDSNTKIGGIVGLNELTILNCINEGKVSATERFGGVVGVNNGSIYDSNNTAEITGLGDESSTLGGIVGENKADAKVDNCQNTGDITGNNVLGGIVGYNYGSLISCTSYATVSGDMISAGGLIGCNNSSGSYDDCSYIGEVLVNGTDTEKEVGELK